MKSWCLSFTNFPLGWKLEENGVFLILCVSFVPNLLECFIGKTAELELLLVTVTNIKYS